jgi:hypothetical protein
LRQVHIAAGHRDRFMPEKFLDGSQILQVFLANTLETGSETGLEYPILVGICRYCNALRGNA